MLGSMLHVLQGCTGRYSCGYWCVRASLSFEGLYKLDMPERVAFPSESSVRAYLIMNRGRPSVLKDIGRAFVPDLKPGRRFNTGCNGVRAENVLERLLEI